MKYLLVNATAAKTGGAQTIIETFLQNIPANLKTHFIVLTGLAIQIDQDNVTIIKKETNGLSTLFFSVLGIIKFQIKYRSRNVISFNNLNSILYPSHGVTYFHQLKALNSDYREKKIRVYRFIITRLLKKNQFILQSGFIKEAFKNAFPDIQKDPIVCWPGFTKPVSENDLQLLPCFEYLDSNTRLGILPIAYATPHKNIAILEPWDFFLEENNLKLITLMNKDAGLKGNSFLNINTITRNQLYCLYDKVDFMVFTSKDETVGLPIFEFLELGKPVFVYHAIYSLYYQEYFDYPKNLFLFKTVEELSELVQKHIDLRVSKRDYSTGEWNKILDLI